MCLSQRQRFLENSNISQTYTETYGYVHTHNYSLSLWSTVTNPNHYGEFQKCCAPVRHYFSIWFRFTLISFPLQHSLYVYLIVSLCCGNMTQVLTNVAICWGGIKNHWEKQNKAGTLKNPFLPISLRECIYI